jgi:DNA-binding response OmpR family regulator
MTQDSSGNSSDPSDKIGDSMAEPLVDDTDGSLKASILVVDDDRGQRLLMRKVLEHKGFEVIEAADGVEACRLNEEHHPDLLLVDLMMPHMDGYELCRKLRGQTRSANVPIVVTTSRDDTASILRAYDAGATDFIPKPVNWLVLSNRIRYILRASRAFAELGRNQDRLAAAEEEAETTNECKSEPVLKSDDGVFSSLSEKTVLSSDWVELDTVDSRISRLQAQRSVAKVRGNVALLNALAEKLSEAWSERERLISQIGNGLGA